MANKYFAILQNYIRANAAEAVGVNKGIGIWKPISASDGHIKVEFEVTEDLTNPFKTLHGGITASFIDVASMAANVASARGMNPVTISLNVNYLAAAKIGDTIVLDARVSRSGKSLSYSEVEMFRKHDNVLVAKALQVNAFPPPNAPAPECLKPKF